MRKDLFQTSSIPKTDTVNNAGGTAYSRSVKESLVSYALTGCMGNTYYVSAKDQNDTLIGLMKSVNDDVFLAKLAVYSREFGYMKDVPSLICAYLHSVQSKQLPKIFSRVIDNGKMLRNFVQITRSGALGRKSFGKSTKRLIQNWLNSCSDTRLMNATVGNDPKLADIIKMVHPKPVDSVRAEFYKWIIGKETDIEKLPGVVRDFEAFKINPEKSTVPNIDFRLIAGIELNESVWKSIAKNASWHTARMNLNTFQRHGVFKDKAVMRAVCDILTDHETIKKARVFPYQLMAAWQATRRDTEFPSKVSNALQEALEISVSNVPSIDGMVSVFPDMSSSMYSSVTGGREVESNVSCADVAALISASILRVNKEAYILPFSTRVFDGIEMNSHDSITTITDKIRAALGGGTAISAPMAHMNMLGKQSDLIIYISDNESWADYRNDASTQSMVEWKKFKKANPKAKMVCIDLTPSVSGQFKSDSADILYIGGFSDNVFDIIRDFYNGAMDGKAAGEVEKVEI